MLRQRVITAAVLVVLIVTAVVALPLAAFGALLAVVVLAGAWEWATLSGFDGVVRYGYCGLMGGLLGLGWWLHDYEPLMTMLLFAAVLFWLLVLFWLRSYAAEPQRRSPAPLWGLAGLLVLLTPWAALLELRQWPESGPELVLFLLVMIWIADSGAYFVGRRWGRRKLAPQISPGKTWAGALGAFSTTLIMALAGAAGFGLAPGWWPVFVALCLVTVAFSIVGDLFESMLKRQWGVKDSGQLLPGHGGVLDRIDSLTAAVPLFVLGLWLLPAWR